MSDIATLGNRQLVPAAEFSSLTSRATPLSLQLEGCTIDEYEQIGRSLSTMSRSQGFWLGDYMLEGQRLFGDASIAAVFKRVFENAPNVMQTLLNKTSVCKMFPIERRRYNLSFTHYAAATGLAPFLQDAVLADAESLGWSAQQVEDEVKRIKQDEIRSLQNDSSRQREVENRKDVAHANWNGEHDVIDVTATVTEIISEESSTEASSLVPPVLETTGEEIGSSLVPADDTQDDDQEDAEDAGFSVEDYFRSATGTLTVPEVVSLIVRLQEWVGQHRPGVQPDEFIA